MERRRLFAPRGGVFGADSTGLSLAPRGGVWGHFGAGCSTVFFPALAVIVGAPAAVNAGLGSRVGMRCARGGVWGRSGAGCSVALFLALNVIAVAPPDVNAGLGRRVGGRSAAHNGDCERFVESRLWSARQVV